ncbi:MAG: metalloprotease PmbA [Candidatus Competibacteraceae bacterium]
MPVSAPQASPLPEQAQLESLVAYALEVAAEQGATAAEAAVNCSNALSVTVRLGEVDTLEQQRDRGLAITVYFEHCKGSASTSDWKREAVADTVRAACDIARHTGADPYSGLADPDQLATVVPDLDLFHPWPLDAEQAISLAKACEAAALRQDQRIRNSEGASVSSTRGQAVYGNSHGFCAGYPSTRHSISCSVIAQEDSGMQRDYWFSSARDRTDLESVESIGRRAAERAVRRLGSRRLGTCRVPVLFAPEMARGVFGHFISAIRGGALYRKASFLVDQLGQPVFPEFLRIHEQPHLPKALGSAPFDNEGVATRERDLVVDGVLQGYVLDSYAARRLGMQTTGNAGGVHNVTIDPGSSGLTELLQQMGAGLLVTHLMGQGINLVTGDYSRGAAGFWVEDGEIRYPVEEITIAGNLRDMLAGIVAVGNDVDKRGNIRCGSLLLERMTVAGQS